MTREELREYNRQYKAKNPEKFREAQARHKAKNPLAQRMRSRAYRERNRDRARALSRAQYAKDIESARMRAKLKQHARRVALGSPRITHKAWLSICDEFNGCCAYCLKPCDRLTIDHFRPVARGGDNSSENIVPACQSCNFSKSDDLIFGWLDRVGI